MSDPIRVVLIDDHPLFREGVAAVLAHDPQIQVVGEGDVASEAVELAQQLHPDIMLLDLELPGGGLSVIQAILAASPQTRIVILTASEQSEQALEAFSAGISGYILKGLPARDLIKIMHNIHAGQGYVPPSLGAVLLRGLNTSPAQQPEPPSPIEALTVREQQILQLIGAGRSNKEIGAALGLTEKTIKYYVSNILLKLQVRNRVEAALLAQKFYV
ncbi:MAG: response regulator transcription factor [Oscillochloris sp.]|nr:response regulator transcription factor [Oscillochloris sp.]